MFLAKSKTVFLGAFILVISLIVVICCLCVIEKKILKNLPGLLLKNLTNAAQNDQPDGDCYNHDFYCIVFLPSIVILEPNAKKAEVGFMSSKNLKSFP
jgi:hypothetical protein